MLSNMFLYLNCFGVDNGCDVCRTFKLRNIELILTLRLEEIWSLIESLRLRTSSTHKNVRRVLLLFRRGSNPDTAT